jgi:hypothetical protein
MQCLSLKLRFKLLYILETDIVFLNGSILGANDEFQDKLDENQTAIQMASAECLSKLGNTGIDFMAPLGINLSLHHLLLILTSAYP